MSKSEATAYIDGASRGNPGPSAFGVVFLWKGKKEKAGNSIGVATNNEAEYYALLHALDMAIQRGVSRLTVYTDSLLLAHQMNGVYRIKAKNLQPLALKALQKIRQLKDFRIVHIPRQRNREADRLANEKLNHEHPESVKRS